MKILLTSLFLLATAPLVMAQPTYDPTKMTCADTRTAIARHGAVTLAYTSKRVPGLPLYKRYVANASYCDSKLTVLSPVPTLDNPNCGVLVCTLRIRTIRNHH